MAGRFLDKQSINCRQQLGQSDVRSFAWPFHADAVKTSPKVITRFLVLQNFACWRLGYGLIWLNNKKAAQSGGRERIESLDRLV